MTKERVDIEKEGKEKSEEPETIVVKELPVQSIREAEIEGKKVRFITIEEALAEIIKLAKS